MEKDEQTKFERILSNSGIDKNSNLAKALVEFIETCKRDSYGEGLDAADLANAEAINFIIKNHTT